MYSITCSVLHNSISLFLSMCLSMACRPTTVRLVMITLYSFSLKQKRFTTCSMNELLRSVSENFLYFSPDESKTNITFFMKHFDRMQSGRLNDFNEGNVENEKHISPSQITNVSLELKFHLKLLSEIQLFYNKISFQCSRKVVCCPYTSMSYILLGSRVTFQTL